MHDWQRYQRELVAREISTLTRYYDRVIQWKTLPHDDGLLLELTDARQKRALSTNEPMVDLRGERSERTAVLLNGVLNHDTDIEGLLNDLHGRLSRTSRVIAIMYNPYYRWLYQAANRFGVRAGETPNTFLTREALANLARLSNFDIVRVRPVVHFPFPAFGVGDPVNRTAPLVPGSSAVGAVWVVVLRPIIEETQRPSLSIVIPARNERGNIEAAVTRLRSLKETGTELEIIFVEGHSSDETWPEIERVKAKYSAEFNIKAFRQDGRGKADAVRKGFAHASSELLTILDADLTMPPELLHRFYDAYCRGLGDFINGSRLTYPMEGDAMRFLNRLGNTFFAKALGRTLDTPLSDSLCGTKLVTAHDYARIQRWRNDFGDFDPFGDFELLFPAAILGLGIIDIPIRYRARAYGATNINRFRHGAQLLKMTGVGLSRIKVGQC
ncbi:MAG: glycosyltransferase family 2 protein [Deltaproteobacteria bacterium]|nr:glycosyltransferase family 2 protein [Deltaproteobacteria bacterium]